MGDNEIVEYFSSQAAAYSVKSERWPWCWLRKREEKVLFDVLGDIVGQTVADMGSGSGYYSRKAIERGARHVFAVDVTQQMVSQCSIPRVHAIQGDVAVVKLPKQVDTVIAAGVLEFVSDPLAVLENAARNCKANGKMVILVPHDRTLSHAYAAFHKLHGISIRLFCQAELEAISHKSGWSVKQVHDTWPFARIVGMENRPK